MSVSNPTLITFVIYIAVMVLIGLMAYRSTNNLSDYILGGRSLGSVVTALSAGASDMSGWLLMGLPGAIYMRSEEHTSELQSLMRISYAVFCLKKKKQQKNTLTY